MANTNPLQGTTVRGMLRAAHRLGSPAHAVIHARWDDLVSAPKPALAGWYLGNGIMHEIVVLRAGESGVEVHDPLQGDQHYSREEFLERWQRDLVILSARPR